MFLKYILLCAIVLVNCIYSNAFAFENEGAIEENSEKQEMSDWVPKFENYLWGKRNRREMPDWVPKSEKELWGKRNRRDVPDCGSKSVKSSSQNNQRKQQSNHQNKPKFDSKKALQQSLAGK